VRVCVYHADPEWSGRARAFADAATALRARGCEVTVVCTRGSMVERRLRSAGHDPIGIRTRGTLLGVGWRLARVLRRSFVEVVFVHSEREQLQAAAAVRLAARGAVVRRTPPFGQLTFGGDARFAGRIAATGFLFAFEGDLRAARLPARALASFVAPPGIAASASAPAARPDEERRIACLFTQETRTAVTSVLRAVALLMDRHPGLRLTLLGPVDRGETLTVQAASLGIAARVDMPRDDATAETDSAAFAAADVGWIVAAGDDAMFGILDCYAGGVPVIVERSPLSQRLVRDGETGVLASALSPAEHAAIVAGLLGDDARRARLARGARAAAEAWPVAAMAEGFLNAIGAAQSRKRRQV
jgi:glycosyltransferase involved in cell wall biosynthesis